MGWEKDQAEKRGLARRDLVSLITDFGILRCPFYDLIIAIIGPGAWTLTWPEPSRCPHTQSMVAAHATRRWEKGAQAEVHMASITDSRFTWSCATIKGSAQNVHTTECQNKKRRKRKLHLK